jgi:serine/threonine protein kinase
VSEDVQAHLAGFRPGSLVAGYRLEAQVGAGGMAVVFRARDERLGRLVALKFLAPALTADGTLRRRFIAEARAAAVVDDPHIIPVYEAGEAGGVLFIAMRFVGGGDLGQVLRREGALPPGRAAAFISPVASALDAAHGAGLVHRDVKPANVLVDTRPGRPDHVYLSDFGISKGAMSSAGLTGAGRVIGTAGYMAPEQIRGDSVDGRADQYALACVAYQLLTASMPFERDAEIAVVYAHLSEPPPALGSRRPGLPAAADWVVARAMAKIPEQRYGSCLDFADALREALGLPPYESRGSDSAPDRAAPEIDPSPFGFSRLAGNGRAAIPADQAAASTLDRMPGGGSLHAAGVPADAPAGSATARAASLSAGKSATAGQPGEPSPGTARSADAANVLTVGPASTVRSEPRHGRGRPGPGRRRWPIMTAALVVLVAVFVGGGYLVVQWTQREYYLGDSNGQVVIYRGISDPSKFLWLSLSHVYSQTPIPLREVPTNYQQTVTTAYATGSLSHVRQALGTISHAVQACHSQYQAQQFWVVAEDKYQAEVAKASAAAKPTTGLRNPGPEPGVGPMCQPARAFGIAPSTLSPTSPARS